MPAILDVAIGTVFVFLLFSFVVSALNELILSTFDQRAKFLHMGLQELFGEEGREWRKGFWNWLTGGLSARVGTGVWTRKLYEHGLISSLSRTETSDSADGTSPSYIPAGAFVTALLDIIRNPPTSGITQPQKGRLAPLPANAGKFAQISWNLRRLLLRWLGPVVIPVAPERSPAQAPASIEIPADVFALAKGAVPWAVATLDRIKVIARGKRSPEERAERRRAVQVLHAVVLSLPRDATKTLTTLAGRDITSITNSHPLAEIGQEVKKQFIDTNTGEATAANIETWIDGISNEQLRTTLQALFLAAGRDVGTFKIALEGWFNASMDRVTGWYKRFAQKWMILIGFVLAAILNVDTIKIVRVLSNNPNLAKAVASQAETYVRDNGRHLSADETTKQVEDERSAGPRGAADALQAYNDSVAKLSAAGIPIGWSEENLRELGLEEFQPTPGGIYNAISRMQFLMEINVGVLFSMLLGWFLTALSASLGAPFWFDLLNKIINIRNAGRPPGERDATSTPTHPPPATLDKTPQ